jgi:hypothetical protein
MKKLLFLLIVLFIQVDSFAQKTDVSLEISIFKEEVKKLQLENIELSTELVSSNSKYENRNDENLGINVFLAIYQIDGFN